MILLINKNIDEDTFVRLFAIGRSFDVDIHPAEIKDTFALMPADEGKFSAFHILDSFQSIYKGLKRLNKTQTIADRQG